MAKLISLIFSFSNSFKSFMLQTMVKEFQFLIELWWYSSCDCKSEVALQENNRKFKVLWKRPTAVLIQDSNTRASNENIDK